MKQMLNYSSVFLAGIKNLTGDLQIFSETEIGTLEKLITETEVSDLSFLRAAKV